MKKNNFKNLMNNFSVSKNFKFSLILPAIILITTIILISVLGSVGSDTVRKGSFTDAVGIGIDFEGGTVLTVTLGADAINENAATNETKIKDAIEKFGVTVSYIQRQSANNEANSSITFRYKNISDSDSEITALNEQIRDTVDALYPELPGNVAYESIGATAANDLLSKAGIALAVSIALILVYIIIRFTLMSAFAAIICLIHDVIIMFCLTVICRVQINTSYVAAMITIISYSINNTIIIFDRCREHIKPLKGQKNIDYLGIGDISVKETLTRSIYTTLTTMITVLFLAILGSDSIREFCIPIILGLVAGVFSSVMIATPLWGYMSISFDKTKEKYASKKNETVVYEKRTEEETKAAEDLEIKKATKQQKQKQNTVYKYNKKNTTFKKK